VLTTVYFVYDAALFPIIAAAREQTLSLDVADTYDAVGVVLAVVWGISMIAQIAAILAWLSRSVDNLQPLTGQRPISSPRMSILWWFIPIANLWQPFRIIRDLREKTARGPVGAGLVLAWWLLFLGTSFLNVFVQGSAFATLDDFTRFAILSIGVDVLFAVEFLLALRLFGSIQRDAEDRAAN
jgi:hypothetical protein